LGREITSANTSKSASTVHHGFKRVSLTQSFWNIENIFWAFRAPVRLLHDLDRERNLINFTMSHRLDSDILWPYAEVVEKSTGNVVAPALNIKWRQPDKKFKG
jgi:hypothetical protein